MNTFAKFLGGILRVLKTPLKLWTQQQKLTAVVAGLGVVLAGLTTTTIALHNEKEPEPTVPSTVQTTPTEAPTTAPTTEPTTAPTTEPTTAPTEPLPVITPKVLEVQELQKQNPHTAGWVYIPNSMVNEVVMFSPDLPDFYLYQTFEGKFSAGGTAYIDEVCDMDPETQVLQIYAHNMLSGTHFATLFNYEQQRFWEKNPYVYFTTGEEARCYEVITAGYFVYYSEPEEGQYRFSSFVGPENEEEFLEHMQEHYDRSVIETGVTADYEDRLLMLVTCAYQEKNGRFVVLAKEVPYVEPEI